MKRIYLTGQRTFSNRGCEAIVRSTVAVLREVYDDIEVLVPSDDIQRDSAQWPEAKYSGAQFVPAYTPWYMRHWAHIQRLPLPILKRVGWPFPFPRWLKQQIASVDLVLSIGGDNYSLDYRLPSLLQGMDGLAMDLGKPVILWGASVGPFEREPYLVPAIQRHLARMDNIFVRESVSNQYLTQELRLDNVSQIVDPAFTLEPQLIDCSEFWPKDNGRGVIGLNVSPLIERYKRKGQDLNSEVLRFVRESVQKAGYGVLLVPHVVPLDNGSYNNDALYMSNILDACNDLGEHVRMAPSTYNAAELKYVISRLRFFIGARTHATIAALSSGIPTISISYSIKARGINRDLFNDEQAVLPTPDLSAQSLHKKLNFLEDNEANIIQMLEEKIPIYHSRVFGAMTLITESNSD